LEIPRFLDLVFGTDSGRLGGLGACRFSKGLRDVVEAVTDELLAFLDLVLGVLTIAFITTPLTNSSL